MSGRALFPDVNTAEQVLQVLTRVRLFVCFWRGLIGWSVVQSADIGWR